MTDPGWRETARANVKLNNSKALAITGGLGAAVALSALFPGFLQCSCDHARRDRHKAEPDQQDQCRENAPPVVTG